MRCSEANMRQGNGAVQFHRWQLSCDVDVECSKSSAHHAACIQATHRAVADLLRVEGKSNGPCARLVRRIQLVIALLSRKTGNPNLSQFFRLSRIGYIQNEDAVVRVVEVGVGQRQLHTPRVGVAVVELPCKLNAGQAPRCGRVGHVENVHSVAVSVSRVGQRELGPRLMMSVAPILRRNSCWLSLPVTAVTE